MQEVFRTVEFGSGRGVRNIFVLVPGNENAEKQLWAARVLLLLRWWVHITGGNLKLFISSLEGMQDPLDNADAVLGCICSGWSTDGKRDHTIRVMKGSRASSKWGGELVWEEPLDTIQRIWIWCRPVLVLNGSYLECTGLAEECINPFLEVVVRKRHSIVIYTSNIKKNVCLSCNNVETCL